MRSYSHIPEIPYLEIAKGKVPGHSLVHKFGAGLLTTDLEPITQSKSYPTPTAAVSLELLSDNAADNAAGIGAREITVIGLDSNWNKISQVKATDGITPVTLDTDIIRLLRWGVSFQDGSGSYASEAIGSHQGNLTLREAGGGTTWSVLTNSPFPIGQSQIGNYTIADEHTGFLLGKQVFVDSAKTADIYFFQRPYADIITAPFPAMRIFEREVGVTGGYGHHFIAPKGPLIGPCDIGFMGSISTGTAECSVEFELFEIENKYLKELFDNL